MRKNVYLILLLAALMAAACSPSEVPAEESADEPASELSNPASAYCQEQGGLLEIRDTPEGQAGVCRFPNGSQCEEWAYLRGDCAPASETDDQPVSYQPSEETPLNPEGDFSMPVAAIYGYVISSGFEEPAESKLVLMPEGLGSVFVAGKNAEIDEQIAAIRDMSEPTNRASFWGWLDCSSKNDCLLTVSRMQADGQDPSPETDQVLAWEGVIYSGSPGSSTSGDDYFVLLGDFRLEYGISAGGETLRQQLELVRDSGQAVRIWGELRAGLADWNAAQIVVSRFELIDADPAAIPNAPQ